MRDKGPKESLAGGRIPRMMIARAVPWRDVGQAQARVPEKVILKVLFGLFS